MTVYKEINDWVYEYFELDTPASEFGDFEPIVNKWNSKRQNSGLPSWSDFDFYDFRGWHGKVNKYSISYNPFNFRVDLFGSEFVELFGKDWTGKTGRDLLHDNINNDFEMEFNEFFCTHSLIARMSGPLPWEGRSHRHCSIIEIPLSQDQKTVTHTIEIML